MVDIIHYLNTENSKYFHVKKNRYIYKEWTNDYLQYSYTDNVNKLDT